MQYTNSNMNRVSLPKRVQVVSPLVEGNSINAIGRMTGVRLCVVSVASPMGFSKKIENHGHAVALHFMFYNFVRIHKTLRVTPAMEAGIASHVWSMEELVALLDSQVLKRAA
jgi:hypothetical protein